MTDAAAPSRTCRRSPCVDAARCQACGECMPLLVCPVSAFERVPSSRQVQVIHRDGCYGCRACVTACPEEAVRWF